MKRASLAATLCAATMLTAVPAVADPRVTFSSGFDYSTGQYGGTEDTEVVVVPLQARVAFSKWTLRASLPYLKVRGPANVSVTLEDGSSPGSGSAPVSTTPGAVARMDEDEGFGDLSLSATRSFNHIAGSSFYVDATGRVRIPVGDEEKGLGVGATDFIVSSEVGFAGRHGGAFVSGGRRFLGDRAGVTREDGWQASTGFWVRPTRKITMGLSYDWRDSSFEDGEDPQDVSVFIARRFNDNWRAEINTGFGFSDASAERSIGMRLSWRNGRRDQH